MKKALIVGINHYPVVGNLFGCVNDAYNVKSALERNGDGTLNFGFHLMTASSAGDAISKGELKDKIKELFADDSDIALFYFAGHGHIEGSGGYLCASDCQRGDDGVALAEVLTYAHTSRAKNRIVILDSCHSGVAGSHPVNTNTSELTEGLTILTASSKDQYASEEKGSGVFTTLLVDALSGAAANLMGDITPGSVYAHIDLSLGTWAQRPVFKTNVKSFVSLKRVQPPIAMADLLRLCEFFPTPGFEFKLDPTFEPEITGRPQGAPPPDPANTPKLAMLQKYYRLNLVVPVDASSMWHAAMASKACKLTAFGEHWRNLVANNLI